MTGEGGTGIRDLMPGIPLANGAAYGINSAAQVVGVVQGMGFVTGSNGQNLQNIQWFDDRLNKVITVQGTAMAINDAGQITGQFVNSHTSQWHAYVSTVANTGLTDLDPKGLNHSTGIDINASGQIVASNGSSLISTPDGLSLTAMAPSSKVLSSNSNLPHAINDAGVVVGALGVSPEVAFVYQLGSDAEPRVIKSLGGTGVNAHTIAYDINNSGVVVGSSFTVAMQQHAFVDGLAGYTGPIDLNSLAALTDGAYFTEARGINDAGQIVANASNGHAYLLSVTPSVPEPSTGLMGIVALAAFAGFRKASKKASTV